MLTRTKSLITLKQLNQKTAVLSYFGSRRQTKLSIDASKEGIRTALLQKHDDHWRPEVYASRAFIKTEALVVVHGLKKKFHVFIYGRPIVAETDHKPLIINCKEGAS
ncbi:unnamed protein product [Lepidochelys olivacea]